MTSALVAAPRDCPPRAEEYTKLAYYFVTGALF